MLRVGLLVEHLVTHVWVGRGRIGGILLRSLLVIVPLSWRVPLLLLLSLVATLTTMLVMRLFSTRSLALKVSHIIAILLEITTFLSVLGVGGSCVLSLFRLIVRPRALLATSSVLLVRIVVILSLEILVMIGLVLAAVVVVVVASMIVLVTELVSVGKATVDT